MVFAEVTGAVHGNRRAKLSTRPVLDEAGWQRLTGALNRVADNLAAEGMRLAYHHHMGTLIQTEEEIDRLMAETKPSVGLLLDTGHLVYAGGDPARVANRYASRIVHLHLKDVRRPILERARAEDLPFMGAVLEGVFTVPGDGMIDYPPVLEPMAKAGYQGWVVVEAEQDPAKAHPLTYAKLGYANVARLAEQAGLR
jgi:inosose dehydratase